MTKLTVLKGRAKLLPTLCAAGAFATMPVVGFAQVDASNTAQDRANSATSTPGASSKSSRGGPATPANQGAAATDNRSTTNATAGGLGSDRGLSSAPGTQGVAPTGSAGGTSEQAKYFSAVDISNDYRLTWDEVGIAYEQEIRQEGLNREEFIDQFDTDGDEFLDEDEYSEFISDIGLEEPENRSSFIDID